MRHTRKHTRRASPCRVKRPTRKHLPPWGYHLSVDARGCDPRSICSKETIHDFIKALVPAIDMIAYGPPQIVRFGKGNKKGYTLVQLIETSDITCHFSEDTDAAYLDVFSCKSFDPKVAMKVFRDHFHPEGCKTRFFARKAY